MPFDSEYRDIARGKKATVLVIVLFCNLILISTQVILKNDQPLLVYLAARLVSPFQAAFQKTTGFVSDSVQRYVFLHGMYRRYRDEHRKNLLLRRENVLLKNRLREAAVQGNASSRFRNFILVHVISVDVSYPYNTVMVDRGKNDGIRADMPVVNLDGDLFGKTIEPLIGATATVRMITSPIGGCGAFLERNLFEGFLAGNNGPTCSFKYLLGNKPVQAGDRVVTSGSDMIFPPYVPIGRVVRVEKDDLSPRITVRPDFLNKPIKNLVILYP